MAKAGFCMSLSKPPLAIICWAICMIAGLDIIEAKSGIPPLPAPPPNHHSLFVSIKMAARYISPYQGYSAHTLSAASNSAPAYHSSEYEPPFLLPIPGDLTIEPHPLPLYNQPPDRPRHRRRPAQSAPIRCNDLMVRISH